MTILSLRPPKLFGLIAVLCTVSAAHVRADVLEMKDGKVLNGKFVGGTAGTLRFETSGGIQVIPVQEALALTFTGHGSGAPAAEKTAAPQVPVQPVPAPPVAASAPAATRITVLAGTPLLVRMMEGVTSKDKPGKRFTATLETDLKANGQTVISQGTKVYGRIAQSKQAGGVIGKSKIELELTDIMIHGTLHPISTGDYREAGANSARGTVKRAGAGAAIGAVVDGGSGAKKGAAIGAATGLLGRGQTVSITPNSLLEFPLKQPLDVSAN